MTALWTRIYVRLANRKRNKARKYCRRFGHKPIQSRAFTTTLYCDGTSEITRYPHENEITCRRCGRVLRPALR